MKIASLGERWLELKMMAEAKLSEWTVADAKTAESTREGARARVRQSQGGGPTLPQDEQTSSAERTR